jgi:hypothetical protein
MATPIEPIRRVVGAFSDNPVFDELGHKLAEIVTTWRSTKAPDLIERYNIVLLCLIELGYNEPLDVDLELPQKYMAAEYHDQQWHKIVKLPEPVTEYTQMREQN